MAYSNLSGLIENKDNSDENESAKIPSKPGHSNTNQLNQIQFLSLNLLLRTPYFIVSN